MHAGRSDAPRRTGPFHLSAAIRDAGPWPPPRGYARREPRLHPDELERYGPLSRVALARRIGLSRTTVGTIIGDLLREGRVREEGTVPSAAPGGRPAILLRLSDA